VRLSGSSIFNSSCPCRHVVRSTQKHKLHKPRPNGSEYRIRRRPRIQPHRPYRTSRHSAQWVDVLFVARRASGAHADCSQVGGVESCLKLSRRSIILLLVTPHALLLRHTGMRHAPLGPPDPIWLARVRAQAAHAREARKTVRASQLEWDCETRIRDPRHTWVTKIGHWPRFLPLGPAPTAAPAGLEEAARYLSGDPPQREGTPFAEAVRSIPAHEPPPPALHVDTGGRLTFLLLLFITFCRAAGCPVRTPRRWCRWTRRPAA
jgi:hypothetical protein